MKDLWQGQQLSEEYTMEVKQLALHRETADGAAFGDKAS